MCSQFKKMQRKSIFCAFLFLSFFYGPLICSQGQQASLNIDRPERVEIPAKSTDETYHVIPVSSTGVLLYFKSVETVNDSLTKWYISLYDKDLHPLWAHGISIRTGLEIRDFSLEKDTLTFLFLISEKTKGITGSEMMIRLECKSGKITESRYTLTGTIVPLKFLTFQAHAFLGYNLKNEPAHIQFIDLESEKVADCPLTSHGTMSTLTGFIIDTLNSTIYATIQKTISKKNIISDLLKINFSGQIVSETEISTNSPLWEIKNPQMILVNPDDLLVIATYSGSGKSVKNELSKGSSSGFFTCRIKNGIQTDIRFIPGDGTPQERRTPFPSCEHCGR